MLLCENNAMKQELYMPQQNRCLRVNVSQLLLSKRKITDDLLLAYFQKIKEGLSNHQSACVSVSPNNNL
jgi:hypothetical protein